MVSAACRGAGSERAVGPGLVPLYCLAVMGANPVGFGWSAEGWGRCREQAIDPSRWWHSALAPEALAGCVRVAGPVAPGRLPGWWLGVSGRSRGACSFASPGRSPGSLIACPSGRLHRGLWPAGLGREPGRLIACPSGRLHKVVMTRRLGQATGRRSASPVPVGGGMVVLIPVRSPKRLMTRRLGQATGRRSASPPYRSAGAWWFWFRSGHRKNWWVATSGWPPGRPMTPLPGAITARLD